MSEREACVGVEATVERLPVDVLAVVDGSGSMGDATASGVSKWSATKEAFQAFLSHAPSDMRFGLSVFPIPGDDLASCSESYYREAAIPFTVVSQMAPGALVQLDAVQPRGQTPTGPALKAALQLAQAYGAEHQGRSVVVVLATDGLPTTCAPTDAAELSRLAREALESVAHVRTLVVASKSLDDSAQLSFERIARAGGTEHPLFIDPRADFAAQLSDALGATAARKVTCDLAMPEPPTGQLLDYDSINVVGDRHGERKALPRVAGPDACAVGGWYYDVNPEKGPASRINVCQSACERVAVDRAAKLSVELGCKTVVK